VSDKAARKLMDLGERRIGDGGEKRGKKEGIVSNSPAKKKKETVDVA